MRSLVVKSAVLGLVLLALPLGALAERASFDGHMQVRVEVQTAQEWELLGTVTDDVWSPDGISVDFPWGVGVGPGSFDVRVAPDKRAALEQSGLRYIVIDDDIGPELTRQVERPLSRGDFDEYMTLLEMYGYINNLATQRPDLCEVFSIGDSLQGRQMWVLHITGETPGPKPAVFYEGVIHAREWIAGPVVLYLANHLVSNYDTDREVEALVDGLDIYLAPCVNPDGYEYTWDTYRLWRKNRRNNGDGTYGVDLNRNWSVGWGGGGSSGDTGDETYRGPFAFSEPETCVLRDYITADPNILAFMDYHSYSELILWPYGYTSAEPPEPDRTTFYTLGYAMQDLIYDVHGHLYDAGPIYSTIYQASGGSVDWAYGDQGRIGFTIELRDTGQYGFQLPPEQILPTCEENLPAILHLTQWAADQRGVHLSFPAGLPDALTPGTPAVVEVKVEATYDSLVPDSETLHYRYDGGAFQTTPLTHLGGNLYQATLPGAACADAPEYYFSAEGGEHRRRLFPRHRAGGDLHRPGG